MRRPLEAITIKCAVAQCANNICGKCMGDRKCVVLAGGRCEWFESAVRPLFGGRLTTSGLGVCRKCGRQYTTGRHSLYCATCAVLVRRERVRERVARHRGHV